MHYIGAWWCGATWRGGEYPCWVCGYAGARGQGVGAIENGISHNAKLPANALYSPAMPFIALAIP